MILTNCAACAAPLAHNAPRCVRCHTRYCNANCQHDHWRRGHLRAALVQARTKVAHARLLATGEATTSFEPVPGLDLEHVVIHGFPPGSAEATCCFLVFWSCAAVALAWLVFFYKY